MVQELAMVQEFAMELLGPTASNRGQGAEKGKVAASARGATDLVDGLNKTRQIQ